MFSVKYFIFILNPQAYCLIQVDILISLSSQSIDESELEEWMLFSTENGKVAIYLKLQDKGHYALDIYAKHKMVKGKRELVCTYLIVSTSGVSDQLKFPILANQKAGSIGEMCVNLKY